MAHSLSHMNLLLGAYVLLLVSVFELLYPSDDLCELRIGCIAMHINIRTCLIESLEDL